MSTLVCRGAAPSAAVGAAAGRPSRRRLNAAAAAAAAPQSYSVTLLPGDGIGPEIMKVAVDCLNVVVRI